ncbi:LysR family transcriptional regulator [Streptomyces mayteni]
MALNLQRLEVLVTVAEAGSFSAAARLLFLSQPSVSHHVRQLEQEVGQPLLERAVGQVRPTPAGAALLRHARPLLRLAEQALAETRHAAGVPTGTLTVGASTTAAANVLPALLARYGARHQGIDHRLVVRNATEIERLLVEGELGLALLAGPRRPNAALATEEVLTDEMVLLAPAGHPLAGARVAPRHLRDSRFLLRERGSATRTLQDAALDRWQVPGATTSTIDDTHAILQAVACGLGLAVLSWLVAVDPIAAGRLVALDIDPAPGEREIVFAHHVNHVPTPAEALLLDLARERKKAGEP